MKRDAAKRLAARIEIHLVRVRRLIPRPLEIEVEDLIQEVEGYKWLDCPNYTSCLHIAGALNWKGLTCRACPVFQAQDDRIRLMRKLAVDEDLRKVRRVWMRRIRRVEEL